MKNRVITVRVSEELFSHIQKIAAASGMSVEKPVTVSDVIRISLEEIFPLDKTSNID